MPTYPNIHLIYNPMARGLQRDERHVITRAQEVLREAGSEVELKETQGPRAARELARDAVDDGADLVLAAGGDGTINEVLNGMVHTQTPMAILPLGTANGLATELGLARPAEKVAAMIPDLVPERISVGFLQTSEHNSRYFLMMAGAGLDANIVVDVDPELKKRLGKLAYWIGGFNKLGSKFPQFEVSIGGDRFLSGFTLASRGRNYGGDLEIAKSASLLSDHFEVVIFEGQDSFRYLWYLTGVLANIREALEGVTIRNATELSFGPAREGEDVHVEVDGELVGRVPATVEIVPRALTLLMPAEFRKRFGAEKPASVLGDLTRTLRTPPGRPTEPR